MTPTSWGSTAALVGLGVAVLAAVSLAGLVAAGVVSTRSGKHRGLLGVACAAIAFQVAHFIEHVAQLGYWIFHPTERPWLTPWADVASDGLTYWCAIIPGQGPGPARGVEALHLAGNSIFLTGVLAMAMLARRGGMPQGTRRPIRRAVAVQSFHVAEHVVLTASLFWIGEPLGVSTAFGLVDPSSAVASSYRVLFHFVINLVATYFALGGLRAMRDHGLLAWRGPLPSRDNRRITAGI